MPRRVVKRMLPKQIAFSFAPQKWAGARGGVGAGKTLGVCDYTLRRMNEYPRHGCFVVGSDFEQLRRGFFQSFIAWLEDLGYEPGRDFRYRDSPSPMLTLIRRGARIRSLSAEQAQRIRSLEMQTLICEEPQTWRNGKAVFGVLNGRLRHTQRTAELYPDLQPQGRMTFNPPNVGHWLYELVEKIWPPQGYPCWRMSVRDNTLLRGREEFVRGLQSSYDPSRWPVEIDGHWATVGGSVYRGFDSSIHCGPAPAGLSPRMVDPSKPLLWALDFNVGWMASVVAQAHVQADMIRGVVKHANKPPETVYGPIVDGWQRRVFYVLDEIFLKDSGTPDVLAEFLRRYGEHARRTGVSIYGDASGGSRSQTMSSQAAARSNWEIIVQGLRAAGITVNFYVPTTNPSVMDRINAMRSQFKTGAGYGMLIDPLTCPNLVVDFQSVEFVEGTNDIKKDMKSDEGRRLTHLSDACGYMIHTEQRRELALRERKKIEWQMIR